MLERFPGRAIVDTRYEPPFDRLPDHGPKGHTVLAAEHVVLDKGTGLVHTAMAFGEEDFVLCERHGIPLINPVREDGTYDERITATRACSSATRSRASSRSCTPPASCGTPSPTCTAYPHCWRCDSKLLYYAKESWYIATRERRHDMLAQNQRIDWRPEHVRDGRFGNWLEGNVDWALSRDRYWGTPLPIWECDSCDAAPLRRLARRAARAGSGALPHGPPPPLHRRRHVGLHSRRLRRHDAAREGDDRHLVRQRLHAVRAVPLSVRGQARGGRAVPADFICEGIDQTRGWFYTSLAVTTLIFGDIPFKHAVCVGHVTDANGHKM